MMDNIEKYILDNYTSPDFPQKYESFIRDNYQDIVPDLILGDETLTDITNKVIKGEEVDDSYLGTFKDYYGESVYEPEVDFTNALALQARYIDDAEYLEWLNDDKMAKVLAEFPTRGDLIDHLGPTIEDISEKYGNDPNLDLLINNMTYKSHPLAFYEFSQSDDFSEKEGDFGFREWVWKGIRAARKIGTQIKNDNKLSSSLDNSEDDTQTIPILTGMNSKSLDSSELDDKISKNIKDKDLELQEVPKSRIREISQGMRPDRNQNDPGSGDKSISEGDMARAPRITEGMVNTLTYEMMKKSRNNMIRNSQKAVLKASKHSYAGISEGKTVTKTTGKVSPYVKGAIGATGVLLTVPAVYKYIKDKREKKLLEQSKPDYEVYNPQYDQKPVNFNLADDMVSDIQKSYKLTPISLSRKDRRLIEECVKYIVDAILLGKIAAFKDMSISTFKNPDGRTDLFVIDSATNKVKAKFRNLDFNLNESDQDKDPNPEDNPDSDSPSGGTPDSQKGSQGKPQGPAIEENTQSSTLPAPRANSNVSAEVNKPKAKDSQDQGEPEYEVVPPKHEEARSSASSSSDPVDNINPDDVVDAKSKVVRPKNDKPGENLHKTRVKRKTAQQTSDEALKASGWKKEEIEKLKQSKYSQSKFGQSKFGRAISNVAGKFGLNLDESKYVKQNREIEKSNKEKDIDDALKTAAGFKDPEPIQDIKGKKGGKSEVYKFANKFANKALRTYSFGKFMGGLGSVAKSVVNGIAALAAPQTIYNRPSVN